MRPKFLLKHLGLYFSAFMMMSNAVSAQDPVITGKVIEKNGSVIPGVSILLKGTNRGTTMDGNGAYKLSLLTEKSSLIFRYIGFTT